jgi:asparagine synthase (glutamine-hydrolysing)
MTMASGLEARVPFLDRPLVEWAFRLPGRHKVRGGRGKLLLRRALARSLPSIAGRAKHGFDVPLGAWLRTRLRPMLLDALSPEAVRRRGLFRPEAVQRLLDAHLAGRGDHARKVFSLLSLELWLCGLAPSAARAEPAVAGLGAER